MPRKKKIKSDEVLFKPSKYQTAIFDFVQHGNGNAVIEAVAGSGKSTTAIKCLELIDKECKVLMTAFNKDIVNDLSKKVNNIPNNSNISCKTMHSLGFGMLMSNYRNVIDPKPNTFKYTSYIYNNINELSDGVYELLEKKDKSKYIDNVKMLVDFGRYYLCENVNDLDFIEKHYRIPIYSNEKKVALSIMEWGKNNIDTIDFTDMIWLPNVLNCKPYGELYDWIICDECQDIMTAERMLLLRCTKMSTRMLFFGEKVQCIYTFMGSDYRSFNELKKLPNTISLPLSISYRCSKNVVNLAKEFNPNIEAKEDAPDGNIEYNIPIDNIKDGDMVLCRNNAPLLQLYCELVKQGKSSYIRGKDAGSDLIKLIEKTKENKISIGLNKKGVIPKLYNNLIDEIDTVMKINKITFDMAIEDMSISAMYDKIKAIEAISLDYEYTEDLIAKIKELFIDKKKKGIELSTIHKAKGLECENVFICCPSLMPSKNAKEYWEIEQERNLMYVAYTRAKTNLYFLDETKFDNFSSNTQRILSELDTIKQKIFKLYGGENRCFLSEPNLEASKRIILSATDTHIDEKYVDIGKIDKNSKVNKFIVNVKKKKKKKI